MGVEQERSSVFVVCEEYDDGISGWSILDVFSSRELAESCIAAIPIVARPYPRMLDDGDELETKWIVELSGNVEYVDTGESLSDAIMRINKRDFLWVREYEVLDKQRES